MRGRSPGPDAAAAARRTDCDGDVSPAFRQRNRSLHHVWLALEATCALCIGRVAVTLPLRYWARFLGESAVETPHVDDPRFSPAKRDVAWAIGAISRRVFWRADCLPQAIAARIMLARRRIPSTIYFGLEKPVDGTWYRRSAHAWVRSGTTILTGERGYRRFSVVSTFATRTDARRS